MNGRSVLLVALGTWGDVYPFSLLIDELKSHNDDATVLTHPEFRKVFSDLGVRTVVTPGGPDETLTSRWGQYLLKNARNPLKADRAVAHLHRSLVGDIIAALEPIIGSHDVVIASAPGMLACVMAKNRGIRTGLLALQPFHPTRAWPCLLLSTTQSFGPVLNRFSHRTVLRGIEETIRMSGGRSDLKKLNGSFYDVLLKGQVKTFYAYSALLAPKPSDWPINAVVGGHLGNEAPPFSTSEPESALMDFLLGDDLVLVTTGSIPVTDPCGLTQNIDAAMQILGLRAVIQIHGVKPMSRTRNTLAVGWISHDWLLPQVKAVVHHGGSGISHSALRNGLPAVVTPIFFDQFFWSQRLHALGVSSRTEPLVDLASGPLAIALEEALEGGCSHAARSLGARIAEEDGSARLISWTKMICSR